MNTVDGRTDAPEAPCPACGLPGEGFVRRDRLIATAQYQCPAGHIWTTKWLEAA